MTRFTLSVTIRRAVLSCLLPGVATSVAAGQSVGRDSVILDWSDPAIATVVLVDSLAVADARAIVIRRGGSAPNNIILVTRTTTPTELSKAVVALDFSRRNQGDKVDREMRTIIRASAETPAARPTRNDQRAARDLRRLENAPPFSIAGVARGPAIVIRMAARVAAPALAKPVR